MEDKKRKLQESGLVEWLVFSELVAMDEDEEGFSESLFATFVEQFDDTVSEIDENLKEKNLDKLSSLGHYLKGSAAALGLIKISTECERIQNYGHKDNFDNFQLEDLSTNHPLGLTEDSDEFWIQLITDAKEKAKEGFQKSKEALNEYFNDDN